MNIFFLIEGGLGKNIMATAVLKALKKKHNKANIHVVTAYPDVFLNNPNVFKVHDANNTGNFYETYVHGTKNKILVSDPYRENAYLNKEKHVIKIWCEMYGLKYNGETPEIFLSQPEVDYYLPFYQKIDKPIMVIQPNGGPTNQNFNYSWTRDIPEPVVNRVIQEFKDEYAIVHIKRKDQTSYPGAMEAMDGFRSIAVLLSISKKRLLIDSFTQHLCKALSLPSTVCWVTTSPKMFGYNLHNNIEAEPFNKAVNYTNKLFEPFLLAEDIGSLPYQQLDNVFNVGKIISSLRK